MLGITDEHGEGLELGELRAVGYVLSLLFSPPFHVLSPFSGRTPRSESVPYMLLREYVLSIRRAWLRSMAVGLWVCRSTHSTEEPYDAVILTDNLTRRAARNALPPIPTIYLWRGPTRSLSSLLALSIAFIASRADPHSTSITNGRYCVAGNRSTRSFSGYLISVNLPVDESTWFPSHDNQIVCTQSAYALRTTTSRDYTHTFHACMSLREYT